MAVEIGAPLARGKSVEAVPRGLSDAAIAAPPPTKIYTMKNSFSAIGFAGIFALACSCTASATPFDSHESAGPVETYAEANSPLGSRRQVVVQAEPATDARFSMVSIAPEPPAIFLPGLAADGVIARCTTALADPRRVSLLDGMVWESFASSTSAASLAWAGEDENYAVLFNLPATPRQVVEEDENEVDTKLLTAVPAPEPPTLVLAGLAVGGVLFRRSLLARRARRIW